VLSDQSPDDPRGGDAPGRGSGNATSRDSPDAMSQTNPYCTALSIPVPRLEVAKESPDANYYALLIVVLLERGEPITLQEAARRFEEAGVAPADSALASLKRCNPARPPIYRDGDLYALDPHDDEADLWAFRLGLRPPRGAALRVVRPEPRPLPSPDSPLSVAHLDEAWRDGVPGGWSAQRTAICVLDAHGVAVDPEQVLAFVRARSKWCPVSADSAKYWRRGAPIRVLEDGRWSLDTLHRAVGSARRAVRERIDVLRRWSDLRPDPAAVKANEERLEKEREAHVALLARMRRVIVHAFPETKPEVVVILDIGRREIKTYNREEIGEVMKTLREYDIIAAVNVRGLLRNLGFDPGQRRLAELGPPQKTVQLNRQGRTLRITLDLLVRSSCGISRPFADRRVLQGYLRRRELSRLRRRLEADAKSLYALYQYGRLHGVVRLRWGFLDDWVRAPWVHRDEPTLYRLMQQAHALGIPLDVVVGSAPGWTDPWSRIQRARVNKQKGGWRSWLVDEIGFVIDERDVQMARLAGRKEEER